MKFALTYFESFFRNPSVFRCVAIIGLVSQTWRPPFGFLARSIVCEVLIG